MPDPSPRDFGLSVRHFRIGPRGRLTELSPDRCPDGHQLGPDKVLVGNHPCIRCTGTGHRTWTCRQCGGTWVWPACDTQPGWPEWPGVP